MLSQDTVLRSIAETQSFFAKAPRDPDTPDTGMRARVAAEYAHAQALPTYVLDQQKFRGRAAGTDRVFGAGPSSETQLVHSQDTRTQIVHSQDTSDKDTLLSKSLIEKRKVRDIKPKYHPDWRLKRVMSGHLGWVRCIAVEPGNAWFATGAGDRLIKIWDLASGQLKLSLTGHISTVRGLAVSDRHPYLFSCAEDKTVKCWDLETNKVVRHYHGHLSGVYSLSLHPTLDVLVSAGRDAVARVWDMRTKTQVMSLEGHTGTIPSVVTQATDPQVMTGSMDATIRLWDLAAARPLSVLTHHHKSVRALALHPHEYSFVSGSAGPSNIKKWRLPEGRFLSNFEGQNAVINTAAINEDGVVFTGADSGSLVFWDYDSTLPFQTLADVPQPGSMDLEAGVFCSAFDKTGSRLITGSADKTVKVYAEG